MLKETIISIVIVIAIFMLDFITQKYTVSSVEETSKSLGQIKTNIEENNGEIQETVNHVFKIWEKRNDKLAYFIEHDELEKVKTNLVNMRTSIDLKKYDMAITNIKETEFILDHIKDKNSFNIQNIF